MCKDKKTIYQRYLKQYMVVECGHCPACLQAKAQKRAARIIAHSNDDFSDYDRVFCNFSYTNDYVPYVKRDEMFDFFNCKRDTLPLYRNKNIRTFYNRHTGEFKEIVNDMDEPLKVFHPDDFVSSYRPDVSIIRYKYLRKANNRFNDVEYGKIGLLYYKDVQDFIKRLRRKLQYLGYDFKIYYFACTEYGSTTIRPHIHLLLFIPKGYFAQLKSTIASCWLFDDMDRRLRNIELAYKPARYIASYVNSDSTVQGLLQLSPFKQKHVYSQNFGFGKKCFSLSALAEKIRRGDITYDQSVFRNGVPKSVAFLYPQYVVSRYFPKFKGFHKLTSDEVYSVAENPLRIFAYLDKLDLWDKEFKVSSKVVGVDKKYDLLYYQYFAPEALKIFHLLLNKKLEFEKICPDWAYLYSRVWSARSSSALKCWHEQINDVQDILESYDNIVDFYSDPQLYDNDFARIPYESKLLDYYETDFNKFRLNLVRDEYYRTLYHKRDKAKKENAAVFGKYNYLV